MVKYYDGTKLLSLKDLDGNRPEIYLCTTNRTGGKTTYFSRMLINRFLKQGKKFCILKRFDGQIKNVSKSFFKDIETLFFAGHEMTEKYYKDLGYTSLLFDGEECGYAVSINCADKIKNISNLFNDVDSMFFDEFQSETTRYCPGEIEKFQSVHTSIARGQNKQSRYVPVYMCANAVTLLNPYYNALDISCRLHKNTKFLKGHGYVLEQGYVESAANAQKQSGFNKAFANSKYILYANENIYLNDNNSFIQHIKGKGKYSFTLKYKDNLFGIYEFLQMGIVYCCKKINIDCPIKLTITTEDHEINYLLLQKNELMIGQLRFLFEKGCFRFADLECKEAILKMLSYY